MKIRLAVLTGVAAVCLQAADCEKLSAFHSSGTVVTLAQTVGAAAFTPPAGPGRGPSAFQSLPSFCRVAITLTPTADSDIRSEVWLPSSGWNGKLQVVGNGGWAGTISYPAMAKALSQGYATASTDTGHSTPGGSFAAGHPEKLIDFGYRAVHETTVQAKALVKAFYAGEPRRSYWNGCSTGGRQGLMSAQRYPADFDGVIAGAPANYMSHLQPWSLAVGLAVHATEESYIPPAKYVVLHKAVIEACDALDGVKDGVIENPMRCSFDPKTIQCQGSDTSACLTAPQVEAARRVYANTVNPRTGAIVFPSLEPGSEMGWAGLAGPQPLGIATDTYRYVINNSPGWDWHMLDLDKDVTAAEKVFAGSVDAVNPDLNAFFNRGGKLLMYHGWNDQLIAPRNSINYFNAVSYTLGTARVDESMRLYMVPGMTHCSGGDGTWDFDMVPQLEGWVEGNKAPERIVVARKNPDRTRPLCRYPQIAVYKGSGSTDDSANFECR